jgi:hypothetical protein
MARFIKVSTVIDGDDSGTWVNSDHVVAVVDHLDFVLVVTTTGTYRSTEQDYIDILSELDMVIHEDHGFAVAGLDAATRASKAKRGAS